jgi:hypothetical protein
MAIRCLFYIPGASVPCEILRAAGCPELTEELHQKIAGRHCETGAFIGCPLFRRVERSLSEHDRNRNPLPLHSAQPGQEIRASA